MGELTKEDLRREKMQGRLNVEFRRVISKRYKLECERSGIEPTPEGLLEFAQSHGLVREIDVCRYMVIDMYPKALYNNNGCKARAIAEIEDIVPVSDRTIWGWVDNLRRRYRRYRHGN